MQANNDLRRGLPRALVGAALAVCFGVLEPPHATAQNLKKGEFYTGSVIDARCVGSLVGSSNASVDYQALRKCTRPLSDFISPLLERIEELERKLAAERAGRESDMANFRTEIFNLLAAWKDAMPVSTAE